MAIEVKGSQIDDAVGSLWAAQAAGEDPQGRGVGTLLVETGARGGDGGERIEVGVLNSENIVEPVGNPA